MSKCLNPEVIGSDAILPKVDNIKSDYRWLPLDDNVWIMDSMDSDPDMPNGDLATVLYYKTKDIGYAKLVADLLSVGFLNPIFFDGFMFGNGHHRLIFAIDQGYTHVPYTDSENDQWRQDGMITYPGDHWH